MITRYIVLTPAISARGVITGVGTLHLQTDRLISAIAALSNAGAEIVDLETMQITKDGDAWAPVGTRYGRLAIMLTGRPGTVE